MINKTLNMNVPPSSVQSAQARSGTSPVSDKPGSRQDGQSANTFGAVLARQIEEKKDAAGNNATTPANTTKTKSTNTSETKTPETASSQVSQDKAQTPDASPIALASILPDNQAIKVPVTPALLSNQEKVPVTPSDAASIALTPALFGERGGKIPVVADLLTNKALATVPAASPDAASMALAASLLGSQEIKAVAAAATCVDSSTTASLPGNPKASVLRATAYLDRTRETADPAMSASSKTDTFVAAQPDLHADPEPLKKAEFSGNLPGAAPSAQAQVLSAGAQVAFSPQLNLQANTAGQTTIAAPLGSSGWPDEFSQKVVWISTQQNQVAELHLNPPDLGPMSIIVNISDNQATVLFTSPHSAVRDAIENALPKLRESLADNGIMLGNTTVSDQPPRDGGAANFMNQRAYTQAEPALMASTESAQATSQLITARRHIGIIDTFA